MKRNFLTVLIAFTTLCMSYGQSITFEMGAGLRIAPIYYEPIGAGVNGAIIDDHRHLTGGHLRSQVSIFNRKRNWSLAILGNFRYDLVVFSDPIMGISNSKKDFISDYRLRLHRYIKVKKLKILVGLEYGFMNNGTEFGIEELVGHVMGQPIYIIRLVDLQFQGPGVSLGLEIKDWTIELNLISTRGSSSLNEKGAFILPELSIMRYIID